MIKKCLDTGRTLEIGDMYYKAIQSELADSNRNIHCDCLHLYFRIKKFCKIDFLYHAAWPAACVSSLLAADDSSKILRT